MFSLEQLLGDEALRRREFPVAGAGIFLAHAAVAPLPRAAVSGMAAFSEAASRGSQEGPFAVGVSERARVLAAGMLGAEVEEIALLGPTSLGLSLVAQGLDWAAGDEVLYCPGDYPANVYVWRSLVRRGVCPVAVRPREPGCIRWETLAPLITRRTRLVALSACHYLSGYRIDLEGIGGRLRERGILFCVDAIQALGAFPVSVRGVDFLAADSHKWLLGPAGAGILYVRGEHQERLAPLLLGAQNVLSPDFIAQEGMVFASGARRYEPGMLNYPGICGMAGSLEMLAEVGAAAVAGRLLALRGQLLEGLAGLGFRPLLEESCHEGDATRSSIVSVWHETRDVAREHERLREAGIAVSLRRAADGRGLLRFAPHFYNTAAELEAVFCRLREWAA